MIIIIIIIISSSSSVTIIIITNKKQPCFQHGLFHKAVHTQSICHARVAGDIIT